MRPALLVIIMDFLVSSLLLYVTDTAVPTGGMHHSHLTALQSQPTVASSLTDAMQAQADADTLAFDALTQRYTASLQDAQVQEARQEAAYFQSVLQETTAARKEAVALASQAQEESARLKQDVAAKADKIAAMESDIAAQQSALEAGDEMQQALQAEIEQKQALQDQLTQSLLEQEALLQTQREREAALQEERTTLAADRALLAQGLASANASLAALQTEKQTLQIQQEEMAVVVESLREHKASQRDALGALAAEKQAVEAKYAEAAAQLAALQEKQAGQDAAQVAAQAEKRAMERQQEALVAKLDALQAQSTSQQEALALLQADRVAQEIQHGQVVSKLDALQSQSTEQHEVLTSGQEAILMGVGGVQASVAELRSQVASLPEELQQILRPMLREAQATNVRGETLLAEIQQQLQTRDPQFVKRLERQLAQSNKGVEKQLEAMQDLLKANATTAAVAEASQVMQERTDLARATQADVGAIAARRLAESDPVFRRMTNARMRVDISLEEKDYLFSGNDRFTQTPIYAMQIDEGIILAHARALGLYWSEIDGDLIHSRYTATALAAVGGQAQPMRIPRASSLGRPCHLVRLYLAADGRSAAPAPLTLFDTLETLLRDAQGSLVLLKHTDPVGNLAFLGTVRHDPASQTLLVESRSAGALSASQGDYLVTSEGSLVGIMKDGSRCLPITRKLMRTVGESFTMGLPDRLAKQARQYQQQCPAP